MAAYLLADLAVLDPAAHPDFLKQVPATLEPFQGKFLVRGTGHETLEGNWNPERVVLIEFPSMAKARAWYQSAAYQAIIPARQKVAKANFLTIIDGVPDS